MSKKLYSVITVLVLLSVFCVLVSLSDMVSAFTVTINTPATNGVVSGTYNFTATISGGAGPGNISNCSWYYSYDSGSTWTIFGSRKNTSELATQYWNVTDTTAWTDAEDIQINVTCFNKTSGIFATSYNCSDVNTGIDVDNVNPTISEINIEDENKIRYVTNPIGITCEGGDIGNTWETTIKVTKPGGSIIEKIVTTSDNWKYEFKNADTNEAGLYYVDCTVAAPYGENKTVSAEQKTFRMIYEDVVVDEGARAEEPVAKLDISTKDANTGLIVGKQGETKTFTIDSVTAHEMEFIEVTFTSAILEIRSDPVRVSLDVGQYKNVDVDGDGTDDIKVTLKEIDNDAAKVEVINLERYAEKQKEERGEAITPEVEEEGRAGLWITILVILIVIGVGYYLLKGKKGKKGQVKFSKQDLGL